MLDTAAWLENFVGRHGSVAYEDDFVIAAVFMQYIQQGNSLTVAANIIVPHRFVQEVMEVKILHMLELGACGGEQFFTHANMRIHGTANIKEQQHFDRIVPLGHHF